MSFELRGLDKLQKHLDDLAKIPDVQEVVKKHSSQLSQNASRRVPVDTGALKRSITLDISNDGFEAKVGSYMEYAPYVNYGTRFQRAQPFLTNSFNEQLPRFTADLEKLMK